MYRTRYVCTFSCVSRLGCNYIHIHIHTLSPIYPLVEHYNALERMLLLLFVSSSMSVVSPARVCGVFTCILVGPRLCVIVLDFISIRCV